MKLSIAWIFDHIATNWRTINIPDLIARFDKTTAEVERFIKVSQDMSLFTLGHVSSITKTELLVDSPEKRKVFTLTARSDIKPGDIVLLKKEGSNYTWAALADLYSEKEGLVPPLFVPENLLKGEWKTHFEAEDYIIELDNKTVTHRSDLWGHRGFAREMAALLNVPMVSEEELFSIKAIKHYDSQAPATPENPFSFEIKTPACKRLAGLYISEITPVASLLWMATRLARIDSRPINALVDMTNYVMYDIGQPMHAFDASAIKSKSIIATFATPGTELTLLDGQEIRLTAQDIIITDGEQPLSLAGVMGGKKSAVTENTSSLVLESANFDGATIRKTAARHKKRTEASARFEKSLDPNQNTHAILRYLKLLDDAAISYKAAPIISSVGPLFNECEITVRHELIERALGRPVSIDFLIETLTKLGFGVHLEGPEGLYKITVPTFRCAKDVRITEDIIEEIGRFLGYPETTTELPIRKTVPVDNHRILQIRYIKNILATALRMHEVYNYALYDAEFLAKINYNPVNAAVLANPVSEHWRQLVTSLIPHLLKNTIQNIPKEDDIRFFEYARVWRRTHQSVIERKALAGIWARPKNTIDFYEAKNMLSVVFKAIDFPVRWEKPKLVNGSILFGDCAPWWHPHQTAALLYNNNCIGYAGMLAPGFIDGQAFIFELDSDFIFSYKAPQKVYKAPSKYQAVSLDISVLVPLTVTVDLLQRTILQADKRIQDVALKDIYENPAWADKKSVTLSFVAVDEHKTMTKEDIDTVWDAVVKEVKALGGAVR